MPSNSSWALPEGCRTEPVPVSAPATSALPKLLTLIVPLFVVDPVMVRSANARGPPLILMLPVLLRLAASSVLAALSPLLPICTKLLLVSVPGTDRLVPPLPNPSSTCSSPDTDRLPLGLTDTPLRRNSRPGDAA